MSIEQEEGQPRSIPWDMQHDVDRRRLDFGQFFEALGPLPCILTTVSGAGLQRDADNILAEWLDNDQSNLLVLSGSYGSGKSRCMARLAQMARRAALPLDFTREQVPSSEQVGVGTVVLIDHFDSLTLATGTQNGPPDLRDVKHLFMPDRKIAIATSRPLNDKGHELVRQLRFRARREALGVRDPHLVELLPWTIELVTAAGQELELGSAKHLTTILASARDDQSAELRRPMVLQMLLDVLTELPEDWIPEIGDVYDQYIEHSLSHDYDHGRSLLSASIKQGTLSDLAYDIFSGRNRQLHQVSHPANLAIATVSQRVKENVQLDSAQLSQLAGYDPVRDFLDTNRVLQAVATPSSRDAEFAFRNSLFYEYFVGAAIAARYGSGQPLNIDGDRFSPATCDSLALYFARRQLTPSTVDNIGNLLDDLSMDWPDRMLMLYILEDKEHFIEHLRRSPPEYVDRLIEASTQTRWHFYAKMAKFQLVCLGRLTAADYIDYVENAEQPKDRSVELQLLRNPQGNVPYFLTRLRNPELVASTPITIYRIAQISPDLARKALDEDGPRESDIRQACEEALVRAIQASTAIRPPSTP